MTKPARHEACKLCMTGTQMIHSISQALKNKGLFSWRILSVTFLGGEPGVGVTPGKLMVGTTSEL